VASLPREPRAALRSEGALQLQQTVNHKLDL
jgi:hypothetical protein